MSNEVIFYDEVQSPLGLLTVCLSDKGICMIEFGPYAVREAVLQQWSRTWAGGASYQRSEERLAEAAGQLNDYFAGTRKEFALPLDLRGTPFQVMVWEALNGIPYGEIRSYKNIAENIGRPKAVRAVGGANNKNPVPLIVPCHRVLGMDGSLVGYGGGLEIKRSLLTLEGSLPKRK